MVLNRRAAAPPTAISAPQPPPPHLLRVLGGDSCFGASSNAAAVEEIATDLARLSRARSVELTRCSLRGSPAGPAQALLLAGSAVEVLEMLATVGPAAAAAVAAAGGAVRVVVLPSAAGGERTLVVNSLPFLCLHFLPVPKQPPVNAVTNRLAVRCDRTGRSAGKALPFACVSTTCLL